MTETCRLRRGEGYEACPDEAGAFLGVGARRWRASTDDRVEDEKPGDKSFHEKISPGKKKENR